MTWRDSEDGRERAAALRFLQCGCGGLTIMGVPAARDMPDIRSSVSCVVRRA